MIPLLPGPMSPDDTGQTRKRKRLSRACNQCRARKVRCDEQQPSCKNCLNAGCPCITTDPKRPDQISVRKRAGTLSSASPITITGSDSQHGRSYSTSNPNSFRDDRSILEDASPLTHVQVGSINTQTPETQLTAQSIIDNAPVRPPRPAIHHRNSWIPQVGGGQQSFAMNTATSTSQRKYMGPSSLQVFTQWLGLTFHTFDQNFSEQFLQGMRHCEEIDMPLQVVIPPIPSDFDWLSYVNTYFQQIASLFSVVETSDIIQAASQLARDTKPADRPAVDRPMIACVYACIAIGAGARGHTTVARTYIESACSLYGHLVASPYLRSAQALLLIAIEHRGRNKDGAAWQVLGQAIRILNSMGLHKEQPHCDVKTQQPDRRVWWAAYALERLIALESGRPASIHDNDIDHDFPTNASSNGRPDILKAFADFAKIQGQITDRLFNKNMWVSPPDLCDILNIQGELDQSLLRWSDDLPDVLKPSRDMLSCPPDILPFRSFLTFQYHQALITLHRAALLSDPAIHNASIDASGVGPEYTRRLRRSETICANSARDIITIFMELSNDNAQPIRLNTLTPPLLAVYVLAIYTLKHPNAWSTRTDLSLLHAGAEAVEEGYKRDGMSPGFYEMLTTLKQFAPRADQLKHVQPTPSRRSPTIAAEQQSFEGDSSFVQTEDSLNEQSLEAMLDETSHLWSRIYTGDFEAMGGMDNGDMHSWMGIPQFSDEDMMNFSL